MFCSKTVEQFGKIVGIFCCTLFVIWFVGTTFRNGFADTIAWPAIHYNDYPNDIAFKENLGKIASDDHPGLKFSDWKKNVPNTCFIEQIKKSCETHFGGVTILRGDDYIGKTTAMKQFLQGQKNVVYLDMLQRPVFGDDFSEMFPQLYSSSKSYWYAKFEKLIKVLFGDRYKSFEKRNGLDKNGFNKHWEVFYKTVEEYEEPLLIVFDHIDQGIHDGVFEEEWRFVTYVRNIVNHTKHKVIMLGSDPWSDKWEQSMAGRRVTYDFLYPCGDETVTADDVAALVYPEYGFKDSFETIAKEIGFVRAHIQRLDGSTVAEIEIMERRHFKTIFKEANSKDREHLKKVCQSLKEESSYVIDNPSSGTSQIFEQFDGYVSKACNFNSDLAFSKFGRKIFMGTCCEVFDECEIVNNDAQDSIIDEILNTVDDTDSEAVDDMLPGEQIDDDEEIVVDNL